MRKTLLLFVSLLGVTLSSVSLSAQQVGTSLTGSQTASIQSSFQSMSAGFIENRGQWDRRALYLSQTKGADVWITSNGAIYDFHQVEGSTRSGQVVQMSFGGKIGRILPKGVNRINRVIDFLKGPQDRHRRVNSYEETLLQNVYPRIDFRSYVQSGKPRYDFIVRPGGNPKSIQLVFKGANGLSVDASGELVIGTKIGDVRQKGLFAYQVVSGSKKPVFARFKKIAPDSIAIDIGAYDSGKELVIDPLVYGTYFGGDSGDDQISGIASDGKGNVYVTGRTIAPDFPILQGAYAYNIKPSYDAFLAVLQTDNYYPTYVSFLGGTNSDMGKFVQVDQYGSVWVAGETESWNWPLGSRQYIVHSPPKSGPTREVNDPNPVIGGTFTLTHPRGGMFTYNWDVDAATIQADYPDFVVSGGPLPDTPIQLDDLETGNVFDEFKISTEDEPPYYNPLHNYVRKYSITGNVISLPDTVGFYPNYGWLYITFGNEDAVVTIPPDGQITAAQVQAALEGLNGIDPGEVDVTGGPLPNSNITVTFLGGGTHNFDGSEDISLNSVKTFVAGGSYRVVGRFDALSRLRARKIFVHRFAPSATSVLDPKQPTSSGVIKLIGSDVADQNLSGFAIKPVGSATGNVELTVAGNAWGDIPDVPDPNPASVSGFIVNMSYVNGANSVTVNSSRCKYTSGSMLTYIGGSYLEMLDEFTGDFVQNSIGNGLAVDAEGAIYVTGTLPGTGNFNTADDPSKFLTTAGVFSGVAGGGGDGRLFRFGDIFVRKYNPTGGVVYSALLGGSGIDQGACIAVDREGNAYVVGISNSSNFPRTPGTLGQVFANAPQVIVAKINANASQLLYCTHIGTEGPVTPRAIAVDQRGNAYISGIVGYTLGMNTSPGKIKLTPTSPAIPNQVAAFDSTYTGGSKPYAGEDRTFNLTRRDDGWQLVSPGDRGVKASTEGFLTVLSPTANGLLFSTYIGKDGNEDVPALHIDHQDNIWIGGRTTVEGVGFWTALGGDTSLHNTYPAVDPEQDDDELGLPEAFLSDLALKWTGHVQGDGFLCKLRLGLPTLNQIVLAPDNLAGGLGVYATGLVSIVDPAPASGVQITVRVLNPTVARLSESGLTSLRLIIPPGQTTATFPVYTKRVLGSTFCDVRAELEGSSILARLTVRPWLSSFALDTESTAGGNTSEASTAGGNVVHGIINLQQPAPAGGVNVTITSDNDALQITTPVVNVPEGLQSVTFDLETQAVATETDVNVTATAEGISLTKPLKLLPASIFEVTFEPTSVNGGEQATGTIVLDGKAKAGATITLTSSGAGVTFDSSTITLTEGQTEATFVVTTAAAPISNTSTTVTATLGSSAADGTLFVLSNDIQSITLDRTYVLGGATVNGVVTITKPAGPSGFNVPIVVTAPVCGTVTPTTVNIAPGQTTGTFVVNTNAILGATKIRSNKSGYSTIYSPTLFVRIPTYTFNATPLSLAGPGSSTGTVTITNRHIDPSSTIVFSITSSDTNVATVPNTISFGPNISSTTFPISISAVGTDTTVDIDVATPGATPQTQTITVLAPTVVSVVMAPTSVTGGSSSTGTVTISSVAPSGGLVISLSSSNPAVTVPASVTIPAGATTATFTATTVPVAADASVTLTATRGPSSSTATLSVLAPNAQSLTFNPTSVKGGSATQGNSTGTITLNQPAPAGGMNVTVNILTNASAISGSYPRTVFVPAGATTATFTVVSNAVSTTKVVSFNAQVGSKTPTPTAYLTVNVNTGG